MDGVEAPLILIQDYHFALLPGLLQEGRAGWDPGVAIFWHIPWPNFEAFGICPWQSEILQGMLGADLIGFHTQYHCNNFLETVERAIECRVDWEQFSVTRGQRVTRVKPFPISVAPEPLDAPASTRAGASPDSAYRPSSWSASAWSGSTTPRGWSSASVPSSVSSCAIRSTASA